MCLVYNNKGSFVKSKCSRPNTWFEFPPRAALRFVDMDRLDLESCHGARVTAKEENKRLSFTIKIERKCSRTEFYYLSCSLIRGAPF